MKINELRVGASNVTVQGKVIQKEDARQVNTKYGKTLRVANIVIQDDSGSMPMSLWNEDIEKVKVGDTVEVENAYVNEFRGNPQLSTGKFGRVKVLSRSGSDDASAAPEDTDDAASGADDEYA